MELLIRLGGYECAVRVSENMTGRPDYTTGRHCNAEYELFVILDGVGKMSVADSEYELSSSDALIICPSVFHGLKEGSANFRYAVFPFDIRSFGKEMQNKLYPCRRVGLSKSSCAVAGDIISDISSKRSFLRERTEARVTLIFSELLSDVLLLSEERDEWQVSSLTRFSVIDDFFEKESSKYGSAELLAKRLHVSVRQLNRILLEKYGMSFRKKLMLARMDRAAWLLRTTKMPISVVSGEIGYISQNSFFKAFYSHFGTSPNKYRKDFYKNEN